MGKYILFTANRTIIYSFYFFFFFIPLAYSGDTSEVFQLNKTWLIYIFTTIIIVAWLCKIITQNKIIIQHTVFTIPLSLFLLSQTISTITSIDIHVSLWGSYGRFIGGYLLTLCYIFLFFAFVSNIKKDHIKYIIYISFLSSCIVLIIGYLGFFGYDSICSTISASSNSSCWTDQNLPKMRVFSTIGHPNWLAAYTTIITIWIVGYLLYAPNTKKLLLYIVSVITASLFYGLILLTGSRSGFMGFIFALSFLLTCIMYMEKKHFVKYQRKTLILLLIIFFLLSAIIGTPFTKRLAFIHSANVQPALVNGGEESIKTRQYLWLGALRIFYHYPIFGSGPETFSQTYPQYRPVEHNMTKEWNFVYDKAHNEYLHVLANTGIVGFATYLLFIGAFLYAFYFSIFRKQNNTLPLIIFSSWISIIITNFFGFADAVVNLFFYLLPALYIILTSHNKTYTFNFFKKTNILVQITAICLVVIIGGYNITLLLERWYADMQYTLGYRHNQQGNYITANSHLLSATYYWNTEPTYANELAKNNGYLAVMYKKSGQNKLAVTHAEAAKNLSDHLVTNHIYNSQLWKDRSLLLGYIAQINPHYGQLGITAAKQATLLSPTSAEYRCILALQYRNANMINEAKKTIQETLILKPNYTESLQNCYNPLYFR